MASKSKREGFGNEDLDENWLETQKVVAVDLPPSRTVKLQLQKSIILNVTGPVTGQKYQFMGAGSIRDDIDILDAPELLKMQTGGSCCGGNSPQHYFVEVE